MQTRSWDRQEMHGILAGTPDEDTKRARREEEVREDDMVNWDISQTDVSISVRDELLGEGELSGSKEYHVY